MKYLLIICALFSLTASAQTPGNWTFVSEHRWQSNIMPVDYAPGQNKDDTSELKTIGNKYDTIHNTFIIDTLKKTITRTWVNKKGIKMNKVIIYEFWENYETSQHDPRYIQNTIYFHTRTRGDIEWHIGEMVVWNNTFKGYRNEYLP